MSWGISPNATEKEKIFTNFADCIQGMNSVCEIDYSAYSQIWDMGRELADKEYQQGRADENKRVVEILHNFYEVRNPEQNAFMDRLVMEVMREQLKEQNKKEEPNMAPQI